MSTPSLNHHHTITNQPTISLTSDEVRENSNVVAMIANEAAVCPEALAVAGNGQQLTYYHLERRASQLASHLQSRGVEPNDIVGVYLKRTTNLVIAALAVLKAGAAYLPLDPAYPDERIEACVADANCKIVITEGCGAGRFRGNVVAWDRERDEIERQPQQAQHACITPEQLAYVIYTSGSTGAPKGVALTHAGLTNLVLWHREVLAVNPADRASHVAGLGFDASVWELWPYLTSGASVHLAADDVRMEPEALRDWMVSRGITIGFAPTPMAERLIRLAWPPETALRTLLTGGETLTSYPPESLPFALVNNYGPTECTVVATSGIVTPGGAGLPPIGKPIANTWVHILDEHMHPVPDGEVGELYIGGAGVAAGYLNPSESQAKFMPDPVYGGAARVYRTGDLGYRLPDGQIAFSGRNDDQIKIRGYRIEPGEIAFVLNSHPGVQASAITVQNRGDDKQLVAYVLPSRAAEVTRDALQEHLRARLPDYMVPSLFVGLDQLPLKASGKVDRSLLPPPTPENVLGDGDGENPRTMIEERVASIVAELLGMAEVARDDNFFLLGGHSLLGTQLIARLRDDFAVEVPLRTLFDRPTVSELSAELERLILAKLQTGRNLAEPIAS